MGKRIHTGKTKMRQDLFNKKQLVSECLPPAEPELKEHIKRANYQGYIWQCATKSMLELPSADGNGWLKNEDDDELVPNKNIMPAVPGRLIELKTCKCKSGFKITDVLVDERNSCVVMTVIVRKTVKVKINMHWKVIKTMNDYQISQYTVGF